MRGVIRDLRSAIRNPKDYTARSNLMWEATMAENRIIKLGKKTNFECHMMEHQLGAFTNCNHGEGLAVLHPVYYRHIYKKGLSKFRRFAVEVWNISAEGKTDEETAIADSCTCVPGAYKVMTREEILEIFKECYKYEKVLDF